ncbi:MAG: PDZ domain-containing protein [Planctomycetes bacterium]|nr:PDZ domain-containing protein [Planctomycetota bacterium]
MESRILFDSIHARRLRRHRAQAAIRADHPARVRGGAIGVILAIAAIAVPAIAAGRAQEQQPPANSAQQAAPAGDAKANEGAAGRSKADEERERRLGEIEKTLRALLDEVQAMRKPAESTGAAEGGASGTTAGAILLSENWTRAIQWRPIGPANMGGRITDISVFPGDSSLFWVATASGGLLKTTNNGITFEHQFDREATVSIGAVAVAPSDPNIVWVGTGEGNPRNSVSYGDGVHKSTDGGKTWKNMGLADTYQIGGLVVHPTDPNIVYVGALGRLYGPNDDRGVFKTTDGGATWNKVLFVDNKTGVIDLIMHPTNPEILIAAMWERRRDGFDSWPGSDVPVPEGYNGYDPIEKWGPGGGLHKTTNGGADWKRLGAGLPSSKLGRVGLDWYAKDPAVVYAIIDCDAIGKGPAPQQTFSGIVGANDGNRAKVVQVMPDSPAAKGGLQVGDVITKIDDQAIDDFDKFLDATRAKRANDKIALVVARGAETPTLEITLTARPGQGGQGAAGGDQPRMWAGFMAEDQGDKIVVSRVLPDTSAAQAGIEPNDVISAVAGKPVANSAALNDLIRNAKSGDKLKLTVVRGSDSKEVEVVVQDAREFFAARGGATPGGQQAPPSGVFMGIQGENAEGGARLTAITEGGPAEKAGLQQGDLVTKINGKPVENYEAVVAVIREGKADDKLKIEIRRGQETKEVELTLATRPGDTTRVRPYGFSYGGQHPNIQDQQGTKGFEYGGIYKSSDEGETWTRINSLNSRPMYFSVIRTDPSNDQHLFVLGVAQYRSSNGGVTFTDDMGRGVHADGHALWVDPKDGRHMLIGVDGGVYATYDRGNNWDHLNQTAIGQFYHVAIAPHAPYRVTGGLQDNGTWLGPSLSKNGSGPINEDWISVGGGDGFMCRVDPQDPDLVYFTSQDGAMSRRNLRTGERASLRPRRPQNAPAYRFNWNSPFILSNHNSKIFYAAGNFVFRSLNKGDNLTPISPEITLTERGSATALAESPRDPNVLYAGTDDGGLWVTRDGGREWKEISKNVGLPGPRWVATIEASRFADGRVHVAFDGHRSDDDDPYVFVSQDFGSTWSSIRANLPRGSTRCLREDLKNEHLLFVGTEFGAWFSLDGGKYWNKFNTNLPTVAVHEFALHPNNGELVAATHGRSLWITDISAIRQLTAEHLTNTIALFAPETVIRWQREASRGGTNRRFVGTNPPAGAQIHYSLPTDAKQVSLKIVDVSGETLRELRVETKAGLHRATWDLSRSAALNRGGPGGAGATGGPGGPRSGGPSGGRGAGRRGPRSADESAPGAAWQSTETPTGEGTPDATNPTPMNPPETQAAEPRAQAEGGRAGQATETSGSGGPGGRAGGGPGAGSRGFGGGARPVPAGSYRVLLTVDGKEFSQVVRVERDPGAPADAVGVEEQEWTDEGDEEEREREHEKETDSRGSSARSDRIDDEESAH